MASRSAIAKKFFNSLFPQSDVSKVWTEDWAILAYIYGALYHHNEIVARCSQRRDYFLRLLNCFTRQGIQDIQQDYMIRTYCVYHQLGARVDRAMLMMMMTMTDEFEFCPPSHNCTRHTWRFICSINTARVAFAKFKLMMDATILADFLFHALNFHRVMECVRRFVDWMNIRFSVIFADILFAKQSKCAQRWESERPQKKRAERTTKMTTRINTTDDRDIGGTLLSKFAVLPIKF